MARKIAKDKLTHDNKKGKYPESINIEKLFQEPDE